MAKKILLVDDSNTVLLMERMILSHGRYDLSTARNGVEGVARAKADHPDLILLDVMMPMMNGLDALAAIRADDATRDIPVIMVTTRSEADSVETGFSRGCNDYVTKPVNSSELLAKVRNLLGE
jgi:DNA-binding response OmpR family regulator